MPEEELRKKGAALTAKIESLLPDFVRSWYALLVIAIKFAGLYGKEVRIVGENRSQLTESAKSRSLP